MIIPFTLKNVQNLLPKENLDEARHLPSYVLEAVELTPVKTVQDVLKIALTEEQSDTEKAAGI